MKSFSNKIEISDGKPAVINGKPPGAQAGPKDEFKDVSLLEMVRIDLMFNMTFIK